MAEASEISQTKLLEAGKKAQQLVRRLGEQYLSADDMADLLTLVYGSKDSSKLERWLYGLDAIRVRGARNLIKRADTETQQTVKTLGLDASIEHLLSDENDREPWLIPPVRDLFKRVCRTEFVIKFLDLDPLSRLGAIALDDPSKADRWDLYENSRCWTEWAETKGSNAVLRGGVKRGKTNFALKLAEMFLAKMWVVVANIRVPNPPEDYHYCATLSDALRVICNARLAGRRVLFILDEGGIFWAKIDTVLRQNKALAKMILTYGKLQTAVVLISHFQSDVPTIMQRTSVADFDKTSVRNVYVNIREGVRVSGRLIAYVPPTTLEYNPEDIQTFSVDLNIDTLFDHISRLPDGKNQWEEMLGYLNNHKGEALDSNLDDEEVAVFLKSKKKENSVTVIADVLDRSRSTVGKWTKGR